jgi:hypothetical protein
VPLVLVAKAPLCCLKTPKGTIQVSKNSPKFRLDPETEFEKYETEFQSRETVPWTDCPHDFMIKLMDLAVFVEGVLEEFQDQVHPSELSYGERTVLYRRLGHLHHRLSQVGLDHRPDPEQIRLVD